MGKTRVVFLGSIIIGIASGIAAISSLDTLSDVFLALSIIFVALLIFIVHRYLVKNRAYSNKQFAKLTAKIDEFEDSLGSVSVGPTPNIELVRTSSIGREHGVDLYTNETEIRKKKRAANSESEESLNARSFSSSKAYAASMKGRAKEVEKFALNSKSENFREPIALAASNGECGFEELCWNLSAFVAGNSQLEGTIQRWNLRWMLLLARVTANQRLTERDANYSAVIFDAVSSIFGASSLGKKDRLLFAEILQEINKFDAALEVLRDAKVDVEDPTQYGLVLANKSRERDDSWGKWLLLVNSIFKRANLAPIDIQEDSNRLPLDRIECTADKQLTDGPLVSVLIPTFNGAKRIRTALDSLVNQSWKKIEIIVIDDGSDGDNFSQLKSICASYPQVTLLLQNRNLGAYVARNRGLSVAQGEFVTVHDDDDWSHPEKIEYQVQHLLMNPEVAGNTTKHVRVTENLVFTRINSNPTYVQNNLSSLMFRKEIIKKIGPWDVANRGADEEFKNRITDIAGLTVEAIGDFPLSFTRTHESSLTAGELSRGYQDPARLIYHSGYKIAHRKLSKGKKLDPSSVVRPANMQPGSRGTDLGEFDVVYVGDFSKLTEQLVRAMYEAEVLKTNGKRIGFMFMHSPLSRVNPGVVDELLTSVSSSGAEFLTLSDKARIEFMVVLDPVLFAFSENLSSNLRVSTAAFQILDGDCNNGIDPVIALNQAVDNFNRLLSVKPKVHFLESAKKYNLYARTYPFVDLVKTPWKTVRELEVSNPRIGNPERIPVVGRHSGLTSTPWPELLSDIEQVFDQSSLQPSFIEQDFSQLSSKAQSILKPNARISKAEGLGIPAYLDTLDFWVASYREKQSSIVPTAIFEALSRGLVVVLPPHLKPIFGNAALYSKPKQIPDLIDRVWREQVLYDEQSNRAIEFSRKLVPAQSRTAEFVAAQ